VKPKASLRLQRERNMEADPRAALLVGALGPQRLVTAVVGASRAALAGRHRR
jgi:hypothetical protein